MVEVTARAAARRGRAADSQGRDQGAAGAFGEPDRPGRQRRSRRRRRAGILGKTACALPGEQHEDWLRRPAVALRHRRDGEGYKSPPITILFDGALEFIPAQRFIVGPNRSSTCVSFDLAMSNLP